MSDIDLFREVEEHKKKREKAFAELRGMFKGIQLGELSSVDRSFMRIMEIMTKGFKSLGDDILLGFEWQLTMNQRVNNLETKMKELETNILLLRQTLDKMVQDR